jgi:hypothetical protein
VSFIVAMDCGHDVEIIDASETPPLFGKWILFPLDNDNSIDSGDEMTCVTCNKTQTVTAVGKDTRDRLCKHRQ